MSITSQVFSNLGTMIFWLCVFRTLMQPSTVELEPQGNWTIARKNWLAFSEVNITQNDGQPFYFCRHVAPLRVFIHGKEM